MTKNDCLVIGIAGGTGSGKSTITNEIIKRFGDNVSIIRHDNYYKAHPEMSYEEKCKLNYDHPNSLDTDLMISDIKKLKAGQKVNAPIYDFTVHDRKSETEIILPKKVLIIEGILIFENKELRDLMDIRVYVDTDADVRILRRVKRDVNHRGRSLESVINQYLETVKPMHEQFVEPYKKYANIIVPEGGHNVVAIEMILHQLEAHVNRRQL